MRIEKLEIKGFGKFNDFTLSLNKGINIIFGNNEGGKTTIQSFIKAMLFGLKSGRSSKDGMLPPSKRYKPWNGNEYTGFLEYRLDNGEVYRVGRNFAGNSVRIFDSLFNDITNSFDVSKDKGVQFAERHMGINEACFEKTVFIRQMDLRIDDSGSNELLSRLANASQTGFEDISFTKAQKALKEALKNYVGTDKTSTRPLDRIIARLDELKVLKKTIIEKKDSLLAVESELAGALTARTELKCRKAILEMAKEIVDLRGIIGNSRKSRDELSGILNSISKDEEELAVISGRVEEFKSTRQKFARFSIYNEEDADNLSTEYQKLSMLMEENKRLQIEKDDKTKSIDNMEIYTGPLKAFGNLGQSVESNVLEIKRDLENLKRAFLMAIKLVIFISGC